MTVDLNCDLGEGFPDDEQIMPFISSANIACGYHAGNEETIRRTIQLCKKYNVAIGAHPSFNDKENFGRTEIQLPLEKIYDIVSMQVSWVRNIAKAEGKSVAHVKPHGALYNMSAKSKSIAHIIAKAAKDVDSSLILFGLSGSHSIDEANLLGLKTANEVFADRNYMDDGSLTPRSHPQALINDENIMNNHLLKMIHEQSVISMNGKSVKVKADTICLHGDGSHAVQFARSINIYLQKNNIAIKAI